MKAGFLDSRLTTPNPAVATVTFMRFEWPKEKSNELVVHGKLDEPCPILYNRSNGPRPPIAQMQSCSI